MVPLRPPGARPITTHLLSQYIYIPKGEKLKKIVEGFETHWVFPQAAGAIDGSHIPIIRPDESASDYYNRKGYYSIIMQAVVDFRGLFMDMYIGWPGKLHDARVCKFLCVFKANEWYFISRLEKEHNYVE